MTVQASLSVEEGGPVVGAMVALGWPRLGQWIAKVAGEAQG